MSSPAEPRPRSALRAFAIAATCTAAMVVNNSNNTSVAIALPRIGMELHVPEAQLQWLVSAYPLSSGCLLLFFGRLADVHGRKRAFVLGSAVLAAFTLACGFASDEIMLAVLRGLQGVGGAATIPASLGTLAHAFPVSRPRSRALAFASFAAGGPIGAAIGMVLGALLTQLSRYTWRAQFFLSAALTFATLVAGHDIIPVQPDIPDTRMDWPGAFLSTAGLVLLIFVLGQGEVAGPPQYHGANIIALLILSIILLTLFALWELRLERAHPIAAPSHPSPHALLLRRAALYTPPPLLRPALFARAGWRVGAMYGVAMLQFCAFMGWAFWVQLYYQAYIGYSPLRTVVRLVPMFVSGLVCNGLVAVFIGRIPVRWFVAAGTLTTTVAPLLFALVVPSASYWAFGFPAAACIVVGTDFVFAAGTLFIAGVCAPEEQSVAGGVFQTMTQIGTSLGVTASTIVFNQVQRRAARGLCDELDAYHAAMWMACAFGVLGALRALFILLSYRFSTSTHLLLFTELVLTQNF
ncbi:efflux transporter [Mycena rebaudengoi]|nr:efflux transporter [Mycena rebaudengoi]